MRGLPRPPYIRVPAISHRLPVTCPQLPQRVTCESKNGAACVAEVVRIIWVAPLNTVQMSSSSDLHLTAMAPHSRVALLSTILVCTWYQQVAAQVWNGIPWDKNGSNCYPNNPFGYYPAPDDPTYNGQVGHAMAICEVLVCSCAPACTKQASSRSQVLSNCQFN